MNTDALLADQVAKVTKYSKEDLARLLNAPVAYVHIRNKPNRFELADVASMMSHLWIRSFDRACWIMHESVRPELARFVQLGIRLDQFAYQPKAESKEAFLNGLPILFTFDLPLLGSKGDVVLMDQSQAEGHLAEEPIADSQGWITSPLILLM